MWETAIFYFNHTSDLVELLNDWAHDHPGVEMRNYQHKISDDPDKGTGMWMFDFKKIGS